MKTVVRCLPDSTLQYYRFKPNFSNDVITLSNSLVSHQEVFSFLIWSSFVLCLSRPLHIAIVQEQTDLAYIQRLIHLVKMSGKSLDIFNYMQQVWVCS